jgi:MoaA/NifB/PqqE/SkfB family radical SAM enzyme
MNEEIVLNGTPRQYELTQPDVAERMSEGGLVFLDFLLPVACNLDCLKCFSEASKAHDNDLLGRGASIEDLSMGKRFELINQAIDLGVKTVMVAGVGEPTSSDQLDEIIDICPRKNVKPIFFTNGSFLDRNRAENYLANGANIVFSVDALDEGNFNTLTGKRGFFGDTYRNLVDALDVASKFEERYGNVKVSKVAVNTTPTLLTYNPAEGVDDLLKFRELIGGRVPHMLTRLSPFGNAAKNWKILAGNDRLERSLVLDEAIERYGCGGFGTSSRSDGFCAAMHNGIATYKGYWMMCPDTGLSRDMGRFPTESVQMHWDKKRELLAKYEDKCCVAEISLG